MQLLRLCLNITFREWEHWGGLASGIGDLHGPVTGVSIAITILLLKALRILEVLVSADLQKQRVQCR